MPTAPIPTRFARPTRGRNRFVWLLLAAGLAAGCGGGGAGAWSVAVDPDGRLAIGHAGRELVGLTGVEAVRLDAGVSMRTGYFDFDVRSRSAAPLAIRERDGRFALEGPEGEAGSVRVEEAGPGTLRVTVEVGPPSSADAVALAFDCRPGDRFWGFGEQYAGVEMRGRRLPVWVSEQGLGREPDDPFWFAGTWSDAYFPMPYFLDPERGTGLLVENPEYAVFDLCGEDPGRWSVEVWHPERISFLVFAGPRPMQVVEQLTAATGRQTAPPDWAFEGVWLAAQGGSESVRAKYAKARDAGVPVAAVWVQDWLGRHSFGAGNWGVRYHWLADPELYPGLAGLIAELGAEGVRFLGYFNNFITENPKFEHWDEAAANGWLAAGPDGSPYSFMINTTNTGGVLDVSNPAAAAWFQGYARAAVGLGMAGWMCDYGEWLPFDALIANGAAASFHNRYPTEWHRLSREVLEEAFPDGDWVLLTRSGHTGEHRVAQVVWAGDQETTWSVHDGLPTVVTAGLTIGMSGIAFWTHDIGGFSGSDPRQKELLLRWIELGAFTPVMRTHEGLLKERNWQFDSDAETIRFFARFGRIHAALLPYLRSLASEAAATGRPLIRHTVLVDPDWPEAFEAHAQWLLGPDLLIAPVVAGGAASAVVRLPDGEWEHLFTGDVQAGRATIEVAAPLGRPAVFVRKGALAEVAAAARE